MVVAASGAAPRRANPSQPSARGAKLRYLMSGFLPIVQQVRGRAQDGQGQGRRPVHCLQLLAGPQAHQANGLNSRLGVSAHPLQGLILGVIGQGGRAGDDDGRGIGARGYRRLQLAYLLCRRVQPGVGGVELHGGDGVLDLDGRHAGRLQLLDGPPHVHGVPESILTIHHQAHVGHAGDAAAMVHGVGHVVQDDVRDSQVRHLPDRAGQKTDLVVQQVGDARRQWIEDVSRHGASGLRQYTAEPLTGV